MVPAQSGSHTQKRSGQRILPPRLRTLDTKNRSMLLIQVKSPLNYKYGNKIPYKENHAKLPLASASASASASAAASAAAAVRLMSRECPGCGDTPLYYQAGRTETIRHE